MPILGALFVSLLAGLAQYFATFLTRKVAVVAAGLVTLGIVTAALYAAVLAVLQPLAVKAFQSDYGLVLSLAFPPIAGTCVAAIGVTWIACAIYRWQRAALSIAVQA